jgi:hypothetical protein
MGLKRSDLRMWLTMFMVCVLLVTGCIGEPASGDPQSVSNAADPTAKILATPAFLARDTPSPAPATQSDAPLVEPGTPEPQDTVPASTTPTGPMDEPPLSAGCSETRDTLQELQAVLRASGTEVAWAVCGHPSPSDCTSKSATISADGQRLAFLSCATNLVQRPDPPSGLFEVYLFNASDGGLRWIPVPGVSESAPIQDLAINEDGTRLALALGFKILAVDTRSLAVQAITPPANATAGCFSLAPSLDAAGRFLAFLSSCNLTAEGQDRYMDAYVADLDGGGIRLVSRARPNATNNGHVVEVKISASGNSVGFVTRSSQVVENDTNQVADAFAYDLLNQTTNRLSLDPQAAQLPFAVRNLTLDGTGRRAAFEAGAAVYVHDKGVGTRRVLGPVDEGEQLKWPLLSEDGTSLAFITTRPLIDDDHDALPDLYRMGLAEGTTRLVTSEMRWGPSCCRYDERPSMDRTLGSVALGLSKDVAAAYDFNGIRDVFLQGADATVRLVSVRPTPEVESIIETRSSADEEWRPSASVPGTGPQHLLLPAPDDQADLYVRVIAIADGTPVQTRNTVVRRG